MRYKILVTALSILLSTSFATGQIIYVDADATGNNDGSSWVDAFVYLQDALAVTHDIWGHHTYFCLFFDFRPGVFLRRTRLSLLSSHLRKAELPGFSHLFSYGYPPVLIYHILSAIKGFFNSPNCCEFFCQSNLLVSKRRGDIIQRLN